VFARVQRFWAPILGSKYGLNDSVCRLAPPYDSGVGSVRFKGGVRSRLSCFVLVLILWSFGVETSQYGPTSLGFCGVSGLQAERCVR
jgi:hypothetical protein